MKIKSLNREGPSYHIIYSLKRTRGKLDSDYSDTTCNVLTIFKFNVKEKSVISNTLFHMNKTVQKKISLSAVPQ